MKSGVHHLSLPTVNKQSLRVRKPNPAKRIYERMGFQVTAEDDVRYFMRPIAVT